MKGYVRQRCPECGATFDYPLGGKDPGRRCLRHPEADLIRWTSRLQTALWLLKRIDDREGRDLEDFVENHDPNEYHSSRIRTGDLNTALFYGRKWGEFREDGLPAIATPAGLFGD